MGVQRLTGDAIRSAAVEVIAEERMSEVREVDADLMRASRRQAKREKRKSAAFCKRRIVCDGALSRGRNHALDDAAGAARDGSCDRAARLRQCALDDGEVDALDRVRRGQEVLHMRLLGDEHESARPAVEAVHGMEGVLFAVRFIVEEHGVGERVMMFAA